MGCSFTNLERVQRLMSTKSTSDYSTSRSTGDKMDAADASGCLRYINTNYHDDDKEIMQVAVDCYVSNRSRERLHSNLVQLAMTAYKSPKMGLKYANTMAQIVGDELMGKTKTDAEKRISWALVSRVIVNIMRQCLRLCLVRFSSRYQKRTI